MRDLFAFFDEEAVDTAFWFTFAGFELPHHPDPASTSTSLRSVSAK